MRGLLTLLTGLLLIAGIANAGPLTPETWVHIDLQARELTIEGMEARLRLLANGQAAQAQAEADQNARNIARLYEEHGTDPGAHAHYGSRNAKAIEDWLDAHPAYRSQYHALERRFESLSGQFQSYRGGN